MGFYTVILKKDLDVHPAHFGKNLNRFLMEKLIKEVEGTTNGKYGLIVAVARIMHIGPGIIRKDGTGFASFNIEYLAIVCRPYIGEVVDTVVTSVNKMGFFAEAGPVQVFVSNHLISQEWEFNAVGDPCYQFCIGTIKDDYLGFIK